MTTVQPYEYNKINNKYKLTELKQLCRDYKLRVSGTKQVLIERLIKHLKYTHYISIIQKYVRRFLVKIYIRNAKPDINARLVNDVDFYTMDGFEKMPIWQYIDVVENGFIYRFNVASLLELYKSTTCKTPVNDNSDYKVVCKNPFTNSVFTNEIYERLKRHIRLSNQFGFPVEITIDNPQIDKIENTIANLFIQIDRLGFYTQADWFISLDRRKLFIMSKNIVDIWEYRMNFTHEQKAKICPRSWRTLFRIINSYGYRHYSENRLREELCFIIKKLISESNEKEQNYIGATIVLMALTLVSQPAASALPWLYQSVL